MGNFPIDHPRSTWCWASRSLSPCHCSVTEIGWWCAGNLPTFCVATFYRLYRMIKALHLMSFVNSAIIFTSHKAHFGLDLAVMQPLSSKNFKVICPHESSFKAALWNTCLGSLRAWGLAVAIPTKGLSEAVPVPTAALPGGECRGCCRCGAMLPRRPPSHLWYVPQGHSQVPLLDVTGRDGFFFAEFWTHLNF